MTKEDLDANKICYFNNLNIADCYMIGTHLNKTCVQRCDGTKPFNLSFHYNCDFGVSGLCGAFSRLRQPLS